MKNEGTRARRPGEKSKGGQESGEGSKSRGEEEKGEKGRVGKQDAALKVDGVSCYVLLSTLGRSPTPASSALVQFGEKSSAKATKII